MITWTCTAKINSPSRNASFPFRFSFLADINGPVDVGCATAYLERHPDLPLARMCIVAQQPPMTDEAIETFLEFLDEVFAGPDEPFSVLWDVRGGAFPTIPQFKRVIAWLDEGDNSATWDRRVQGNAAIIRNPIFRAGARLMVKVAKPPQPSFICKSEPAALEFARETCGTARSWA